jgi:hypothetical protein
MSFHWAISESFLFHFPIFEIRIKLFYFAFYTNNPLKLFYFVTAFCFDFVIVDFQPEFFTTIEFFLDELFLVRVVLG